ncbi:hypothetical protein D3C74_434880 [compost metagenome]
MPLTASAAAWTLKVRPGPLAPREVLNWEIFRSMPCSFRVFSVTSGCRMLSGTSSMICLPLRLSALWSDRGTAACRASSNARQSTS